jgi:hypothetical protein
LAYRGILFHGDDVSGIESNPITYLNRITFTFCDGRIGTYW